MRFHFDELLEQSLLDEQVEGRRGVELFDHVGEQHVGQEHV